MHVYSLQIRITCVMRGTHLSRIPLSKAPNINAILVSESFRAVTISFLVIISEVADLSSFCAPSSIASFGRNSQSTPSVLQEIN